VFHCEKILPMYWTSLHNLENISFIKNEFNK